MCSGDLAKSWTVSPDGKTYTFKLHDGVKFHDGSALTSADIKASYERIARPPQGIISARLSSWADLDTIETPDPATVVFKTEGAGRGPARPLRQPVQLHLLGGQARAEPALSRDRDHGLGRLPVRRPRQGLELGRQALRGLLPQGPALPRRLQGVLRQEQRGRARHARRPVRHRVSRRAIRRKPSSS